MTQSTAKQRQLWAAYECKPEKMARIAFGPDVIRVAPETVDAWAALAAVFKAHGYTIRTPDTDSYNCRDIKGGGGKSLHSFGIALDVNWDTNPFQQTPDQRKVRFSDKPTQKERAEDVRLGRADTDVTAEMVTDCLAIKTKNGVGVFEWGGNWHTVKDTMHWEIDCSPGELAAGIDPATVAHEPGPPIPPLPGPPHVDLPELSYGSRGEEVKHVQQLLMVDGIYGHLTREAVQRFQKARGLNVDGIVGPYTWRALLGPEPSTDGGDWRTEIKATTFGGSAETERSAYPPYARIGDTEIAGALPYTFVGKLPVIEVRNRETGKVVEVPIKDKGPWNTNDAAYVMNGARPQAESGTDLRGRETNKAGIDLSPRAVHELGFAYSPGWSGEVDWRFKPDPSVVAAQQQANTPPQPTEVPMPTPTVVTAPVISTWASKINWVNVGGAALTLFTAFAAGLPPEQAAAATAIINVVQSVVTIVFRTFFTKSVVAPSVKSTGL